MNKCLNCGKEVKNKYCNVSCQNSHQCKGRKLSKHSIEQRTLTNKAKWKSFEVKCCICEIKINIKEYKVNSPKKDKYYCSSKCSHTRKQTEETKIKISQGVKKSEVFKINNAKAAAERKTKGIPKKERIISKCEKCNKPLIFLPSAPRKYHLKCWLSISGGYKKGSSRGKSGWYKGYWCDSSYELAWVIYALDNNISFTRNTLGFTYFHEGAEHKFYPDFILEDGSYLEIKNFTSELTNSKLKHFPYPIQVWYKDTMKKYIDYAIEKHGKDFIKLYGPGA